MAAATMMNLMTRTNLIELIVFWDMSGYLGLGFCAGTTSSLEGLLRSCVLDVPKESFFRYLSAGISPLFRKYFCA